MAKKAGDIFYEYDGPNVPEMTRGELEDFYLDIIEELLDTDDGDRLSDGRVCDALLRYLDDAVQTPEQYERLIEFLKAWPGDSG